MNNKKLTLKRDVLQELGSDELAGVVAGTATGTGAGQTRHSCLAYISCFQQHCVGHTVNCVPPE
jgi:hypothetical protein